MKYILIFIALVAFITFPPFSYALDSHTALEEKEGEELFRKLSKKELTCNDLKENEFASLGEFFMGKMVGNTHDSMNQMMTKMMGESGEEQMHAVFGKRMSGCDSNAQMTNKGGGEFMMGQWGFSNMMGGGGFWGSLLWLVILIDLILLGIWLWKKIQEK